MGQILRDIYTDTSISSLLGFKGGTCAYFFYGLTRFSVDLDFDLFTTDEESQKLVYEKVLAMLKKHGEVKDSHIKHQTIFFLLSYGKDDHNVKIEVSIRIIVSNLKAHYEVKEHLGISMQVGKEDYLFASKLAALTERDITAPRDIYDIWYFAKNRWDINETVIKERTGMAVSEYLADCIEVIEAVKDNEILRGLGELLDSEKDKAWVKAHLREEAIFQLKNYQATLTRKG